VTVGQRVIGGETVLATLLPAETTRTTPANVSIVSSTSCQ
jgi:hypothetical protein